MERGREIVLKERHEGQDSGGALSSLEMEERFISPRVIAEMKGKIYFLVNIFLKDSVIAGFRNDVTRTQTDTNF